LLRALNSTRMNDAIHELDVVALLKDRLDRGLVAGQVGTVVQSLADDHFEVEFSGDDGRAYAMAAIPARDLMVLHYAPVTA
jgi:membrane protein implicated in regulation of membrane protease activity